MAHMQDGHPGLPPSVEQDGNPLFGLRVVARSPFRIVDRKLNVDDEQRCLGSER